MTYYWHGAGEKLLLTEADCATPPGFKSGGVAIAIRDNEIQRIAAMKPLRVFLRSKFTLLAFATALASTLLFAGCTTTDSGNNVPRDLDRSGHHH